MLKNYMKVLWLGLLLIAVVVQAKDEVVFTNPAKMITIKQSDPVFSIILQSNPTTGYSWFLKSYDANLISLVGHKFYSPVNKKLAGAPRYEKWTFRVKPGGFAVPQLTSITLICLRPWEEQGAQVINFKVVTYNAN
jgi:inhibitor of cysteine peptidase